MAANGHQVVCTCCGAIMQSIASDQLQCSATRQYTLYIGMSSTSCRWSCVVCNCRSVASCAVHFVGYGFYRPQMTLFDPGWRGEQTKGPEDWGVADLGNDPMGIIDRYVWVWLFGWYEACAVMGM